MYMVWENEQLDWLRMYQNQLRFDNYNAVCDAGFAGKRDPASVGQRVYIYQQNFRCCLIIIIIFSIQ